MVWEAILLFDIKHASTYDPTVTYIPQVFLLSVLERKMHPLFHLNGFIAHCAGFIRHNDAGNAHQDTAGQRVVFTFPCSDCKPEGRIQNSLPVFVIKCAKAPCFREVSHTLVHFGEKEWHRNRSSDACTFSCFILRR